MVYEWHSPNDASAMQGRLVIAKGIVYLRRPIDITTKHSHVCHSHASTNKGPSKVITALNQRVITICNYNLNGLKLLV